MFDFSKISYVELWSFFNPRLVNKNNKKVKTKIIGSVDYFPDGLSKKSLICDFLMSRDIPFRMLRYKVGYHDMSIITLYFDKDYADVVGDYITNIDKQILVLYGREASDSFISRRTDIFSRMFDDCSEKKLEQLTYH